MNKLKVILPIVAVILVSVIAVVVLFFSIRITTGPVIFECGGDEYAVVWATSLKGSGYVKYIYNGEEKIVWDSKSGTIATDDSIHMVKVPKEELKNNTYRVGSQYVMLKMGYHALKGKTVESDEIRFNGDEKQDDIRALCISDIHGETKQMQQSLSYFTETPDIIFMIGDISSEMIFKSQFEKNILRNASILSGGSIPVIYTRGNHETRGEFSSQMLDYFPTNTGEFYFTFDFGALSVLVLDSGEDKDDDHKEYSGLVNFASYRQQELNWISSLKKEDFDGRYKIVLSHDPVIGTDYFGKDWETPLKNLEMDMVIGGHLHESKFIDGELPRFVDCGKCKDENDKDKWAASMVTFKNGKISMLTINNEGKTLLSEETEVK